MFCGMPGYKPSYAERNAHRSEDKSGKNNLNYKWPFPSCFAIANLVGFLDWKRKQNAKS